MSSNARFSVILLILSVLMSGCGDEDGSPPVLTDYHVPWPPRFVVGFSEGSGKGTIFGDVSFEDPDGDVVLLTVSWQDCGMDAVKKLEILQENLQGAKTGEISFRTVIDTYCPPGVYTVSLSAADGRGNTSNVLAVPYEIYE